MKTGFIAWVLALVFLAGMIASPCSAQEEAAPSGPPKVPGLVKARPGGGYVQLVLEGVMLKVKFYDAKAQPEAAPFATGYARVQWAAKRPERYILARDADGMTLAANKPMRSPFVFRVFLTLTEGPDGASESYSGGYGGAEEGPEAEGDDSGGQQATE